MKAVISVSSSSTSSPAGEFGPNEWLVEEMYQRFLDDPTTVDPAWHEFFADYRPTDTAAADTAAADTADDSAGTGSAKPPAAAAAPAPVAERPAPTERARTTDRATFTPSAPAGGTNGSAV